jgi:hypothetical protein
VLERTLTLRLGDRTIKAGAGSLAGVPPGVVHSFREDGDGPIRVFDFNTPARCSPSPGPTGSFEATPRRGLRSASQHERRPRLALFPLRRRHTRETRRPAGSGDRNTQSRPNVVRHRPVAVAQWRAAGPFVDGASIMGKIVRRVLDGDVTLIEWSPSDPATVEAAEMIFRREVEGGYVAVVEDDGVHSRRVRSLPVDAERVVMTTAMGGG